MIAAGTPARKDLHRIRYLDGLRGVAILMVLLYHAYVRWSEIIPFGDRFSGNPLFANGWLGVNLFFMISGYVIYMTLDKPQSPASFFVRRWLRLFPAMLVCSIIIYSTAAFFFERPAGIPAIRDLLPGLTFIDPIWWQKLIGPPQGQLEGAFWSLYVEVKFYLLAGLFYFFLGEKKMVWMLCILSLSYVALPFLSAFFPDAAWSVPRQIVFVLSARYFGWFAAGTLFYLYVRDQRPYMLILAVVMGLISALSLPLAGWEMQASVAGIAVVLLFTASILSQRMQSWLANRFLLFLGFASYPLYLLHENMMVSLIAKTGNLAPWMPALLIPVLPMSIVITLGWLVARYAEPWTRKSILNSYRHVSGLFRSTQK